MVIVDVFCIALGLVLRVFAGGIARCLHLPLAVNGQCSKQQFLQAILGGTYRSDLDRWTGNFLNRLIPRGMYRKGLAVLEQHRHAGDVLVLLTASLDCYAVELGRRLGFDEVICTKTEWQEERLSGKLAGPNVRGEEKVRSLLELKTRFRDARIIAYADHQSDLPLLRLADQGVLVNAKPKVRDLASREQIEYDVWKE